MNLRKTLQAAAVALSIAVLTPLALAQQGGRDPGAPAPAAGRGAGRAGRGPMVNSPEVRPDRTVTLRIAAPNAASVTVGVGAS